MRLIDADALKDNLFDYAPLEMMWDRADIGHKIDEMPTVDVAPVVHGKWDILITKHNCDRWQADIQCSNCGKMQYGIWSGFFPNVPASIARDIVRKYANNIQQSYYCSNCGAKMDKQGEKL